MIDNSNLEFHETFKPELLYIAKILRLAFENFSGTKLEISEYSGIPTGERKGKVVPHIKYAAYMGLIKYTVTKGVISLRLTPLGAEVLSQDPNLHENITAWICHYGMTKMVDGAPQWAYWVHCAHPSLDMLVTNESLVSQAKLWCNIPAGSLWRKVFSVVRGSYTEGCFERLGFVEWDNDCFAFQELSSKQDLIYVYAYALFDSWDRIFPQKHEITMLEVKNCIGFDRIFGFTEDECDFVLDLLYDEGLININRQLYPATIIRTMSTAEIIPQLYSRLL